MKTNIKILVLVLAGSIYSFMLFVSGICSAASYPTSTATPLANDLSMNQYKLNDVGDIITKGPWVDARAYNGGTFNDVTINAAITAIGTNNKTLLLASGTWTISANVTVPSNINLRFEQGAVLSIGATYTFTINGPIDAPVTQIFSGSGTVSFGAGYVKEGYPQWWGAKGDGTTNDATAVQKALDSLGTRKIRILISGVMGLGSSGWSGLLIDSKSNVTILAADKNSGFKILAQPTQGITGFSYVVLKILSSTYVEIKGLNFNANSINTIPIGLDNCSYCVIEGNNIYDGGGGTSDPLDNGITSVKGSHNKYFENTIKNMGRGMWIGNTSTGYTENGALIESNDVFSNRATGIGFMGSNSVISNNKSLDNAGSGIVLGSSSNNTYENISVVGNYAKGNTFSGIQADPVSTTAPKYVTITGNLLNENKDDGIYGWNIHQWTISGNVMRDNNIDNVGTGAGIRILQTGNYYSKNITIANNTIGDTRTGTSRTQDYGIYLDTYDTVDALQDILIEGNIVHNNASTGIFLGRNTSGNGTNISLIGNISRDNGYDGFNVVPGFKKVNLIGNVFLNNANYDWRNQIGSELNYENNIFSTKSGSITQPSLPQIDRPVLVFAASDTTPDVSSGVIFKTANTGSTSIWKFNGAVGGQIFTVLFTDSYTTLSVAEGRLKLSGGVNFISTPNDTITLYTPEGTYFYEISRSVN